MSCEKYRKVQTFAARVEKGVTNIDKDGNWTVVTTSCIIKLVDTARFMASSLSNLVDDLEKGIHKIRCKDCDYFLKYKSVKDNLIKYKGFLAIKIIKKKLMKN